MRNIKQYIIFSLYIVFSSGCMEPGISWTWNEYQAAIKPEAYQWQKDGVSDEQRIKDWVECGGNRNGLFPWDEAKIKNEMRLGDINSFHNKYQAYERLRNNTRNCMKKKGYY